jgi:hypothetical protein
MKKKLAIGWLMAACAAIACSDPAHDRAVEALGGEAPGVPEGPLHRPGQPCVTCHGPDGPAAGEFSVAGTVYGLLRESEPVPNVAVRVRDITGSERTTTTNQAGNFFIRSEEWRPVYPLQTNIRLGNLSKQMSTYIARAASCADCHVHPPGPNSPGQIYIATSPSELPGAGQGP